MAENKAEQLRIQEKLAKAKARSQVYEEMEERMPLNPKTQDHGLEENSAVDTQVKKEHCKHAAILCGNVKDIRNDQRKSMVAVVDQSSKSKSIQKGEVRKNLLMYHQTWAE